MTYYEVPKRLDQTYLWKSQRTLIGGELYTENECEKFGINIGAMIKRVIKRTEIFFFFGARFSTNKN